MKRIFHGVGIVLVAFVLCSNRVVAQDFSALAPMLPDLSMLFKQFTGGVPTFDADATVTLSGGNLKAPMIMPSRFTFHDSNMRWDLDGARLEGFPEGTVQNLKMGRLDKMRFVFQMKQKKHYLIFDNLRAYLETPVPASVFEEVEREEKRLKLETKILGQESFDGYSCTKKSLATPEEIESNQATIIWTAKELKDFPVKIHLKASTGDTIVHFRNVKFSVPPAGTFEVSTNFVRKADSRDIIAYAHSLAEKSPKGTGK